MKHDMVWAERGERLGLIIPMVVAPFVPPHVAVVIALSAIGASIYSLLNRKLVS